MNIFTVRYCLLNEKERVLAKEHRGDIWLTTEDINRAHYIAGPTRPQYFMWVEETQ